MRLFNPSQYQTADTQSGLLSIYFFNLEKALGIVVAKLVLQLVAAFGYRPYATPFPVAHFENLVDELLRARIAFACNDTAVLVLDVSSASFELLDGFQNSI